MVRTETALTLKRCMAEAAADTDTDDPQENAHTSARMSGPMQRIEVITGTERRRRWSWEQKQAIVAESVAPHASPTVIARRSLGRVVHAGALS